MGAELKLPIRIKVAIVVLAVLGSAMVADRIRPLIFGYYATWFLRGGFLPYCVRSPVEAYIKGEGCIVGLYSPLTKDYANVIVGNTQYCPLLLAFKHRNLEVAEELLNLGADPMRCSGYPDIFFGNDCNHGPKQARRLYDIYRRAGSVIQIHKCC